MKKYVVNIDANSFSGNQNFLVEADSEEGAVRVFKSSGGVFLEEEVCIEGLEYEPNCVWEYEEPEVQPEIRPIDEHEWSDCYIGVYIANNGNVEIRTANDEFYLNDADLAVILKAKGYRMVKE